MKNRKTRVLQRVLAVLVIIAAICMVGYFAICYWVNATSGSLLGSSDSTKIDTGSAVVVDGTDRKDGVFTLFVGVTDEEGLRTDSMMVIVFDTENHAVNVINIPRDTLVDTDRTGAGRKLNAAYASGIETTLEEVSDIIGFCPDKYVIASFDGIAEIVDAIGGVDYEIPFDMSYHDESQDLSIEFEAGWQHLDGEEVVEFLRWRHNDDGEGYEDGDIGRVENLQTFLKTLGESFLTASNILKIPTIASTISENVETDLTASQILWIGMQTMEVDMDNVNMETLYGDAADVDLGVTLSFYILDEEMVIEQINESFNPYTYDLTEEFFNIITPYDLGVYDSDWQTAKALRYATYEDDDEDDETDTDEDAESEDEEDETDADDTSDTSDTSETTDTTDSGASNTTRPEAPPDAGGGPGNPR